MKKNYIAPSVKNVKVETVSMMAVSIGDNSEDHSHVGSTKEESFDDSVWEYEW